MQLLWEVCSLAGRAAGSVEGWRGPCSALRGSWAGGNALGSPRLRKAGPPGEYFHRLPCAHSVQTKEQCVCRMGPELQILFTAVLSPQGEAAGQELAGCSVLASQAQPLWIPLGGSLQNIRVEQNPAPKGETCSFRRM